MIQTGAATIAIANRTMTIKASQAMRRRASLLIMIFCRQEDTKNEHRALIICEKLRNVTKRFSLQEDQDRTLIAVRQFLHTMRIYFHPLCLNQNASVY